MPTYDYKCKACGESMEIFQSIKESPKRKCPKCGKNALERLIGTGGAIIFKGSGFYLTDYRSEAYKKSAEADKPQSDSKSDSQAKPDSASDSKPDAKPDTKPSAKPSAKPDAAPAPKVEAKPEAKPSAAKRSAAGKPGAGGRSKSKS